jgi:hypothetical protein
MRWCLRSGERQKIVAENRMRLVFAHPGSAELFISAARRAHVLVEDEIAL